MSIYYLTKKYGLTFGLVCCFQLLFIQMAIAQGGDNVKGLVSDEKNLPLPGVTIIAKNVQTNASSNAQTDTQGIFKFKIASGQYIFIISSVGYQSQTLSNYTVKVGETISITVKLKESANNLDQVVVIGYGSQQKRLVTGSVAKVNGADLNKFPGGNFAQQLAGKAAGVSINEASAQPGTDPQIIVRGVGTLTAGKSPLIVVDGFPLTEGSSLNSINPSDIETLDILKDPASAAIYGSRAANGVVLVTTKKSQADKVKLSVDVFSGIQSRSDNFKLIENAYDAALYYTEARNNGYVSLNPGVNLITDDRATRVSRGAGLRQLNLNYIQPYLDRLPNLTNTNWLDEIFQTAPINSFNISASGGTAKTNYYLSTNYFDQDGIVINTGLKRYSGNFKLDSKISDHLDLGFSINPSYNIQNYFLNNANTANDIISMATLMMPFFPVYNSDGSYAISQQIRSNTPEDGALGENPVAFANMNTNLRTIFRNFGNTYLKYKIIDGLTYKALLGADYTNSSQQNFSPSNVGVYRTAAPKPATASETGAYVLNYLLENTLTFSKVIDKHDLNILGGYSFQKEEGSSTLINGTGIPDDNISNIGGASAHNVTSEKYRWAQISYFGRLQYGFGQKYLASLTMRGDGSSRFGQNKKWGYFPSVTSGWIISKEGFFPENKTLTFAKLRATWGKSGNNQIGNYGSIATVTGGALANYVFGNALSSGFTATTTPNPNLTWETRSSTNLGLDLTFFNKLNLTAEYYNGTTKNLLLNVPVPEQSGFSTSLQNIGKVRNSGLEFDLSGSDFNLGKVKWGFSTNISLNKSEVLALAPGQTQIIQGNESNIITKVGGPIAEFYG
ncbi:SusC/RagA family TonB-linked outer membrane protein [Pedobacter sandarakinus]|uniref:SusC/RagA family TonB-linked outer membrane protein n=1 Tax=Pedobacter sandarakinus TaxID=353156 RepID=UPI002247DD04|nr:SusC/RagA family TonB-linked outer membrane protein [Pedobacter sandarakinus]MCX2574591.1 SusC/RagA family TonB-linked outer membrane protein [Pedobacter sandarakinus]